jgi:hypothetical protein
MTFLPIILNAVKNQVLNVGQASVPAILILKHYSCIPAGRLVPSLTPSNPIRLGWTLPRHLPDGREGNSDEIGKRFR